MICNQQIWTATVVSAQSRVSGLADKAASAAWLRAINRALELFQTTKYWSFDMQSNTLRVISDTSGQFYTLTGDACTCKANERKPMPCKHRALRALLKSYYAGPIQVWRAV